MATLSWPDKDPDDILDYMVDWSSRLTGTDIIVGSTFSLVTGSEAGVTIASSSFDSDSAVVWLSGGNDGDTCRVLNRVTSRDGRQWDQTVKLPIRAH